MNVSYFISLTTDLDDLYYRYEIFLPKVEIVNF